MNASCLILEDFGFEPGDQRNVTSVGDVKSLTKQAFDDGYRDGWNDAFNETRNEEEIAQSNISTALQELSFTYFEARQHIIGSVRPLLEEMLNSVLPHASAASLVAQIQDEIQTLVKDMNPPITLLCAPQNLDRLKELASHQSSSPIQVQPEDTLTDTQIRIVTSDGFTAFDSNATIENIRTSISRFFEVINRGDVTHG